MRRILAIASLMALILSVAGPLWAAHCASMGKVAMCHRSVAQQHEHHCDTMMEEQNDTGAPDSESTIRSLPAKCPMQCCMQTQSGTETAVSAISLLPELTVSDSAIDFPTIIFVSNGFSSHTDRGPPQA